LYEAATPTEAPTATPTAAPFKEITITWGAGVNAQCGHQCKIHAERCTHYEFDSTTRECKLYEAATPTEAPTATPTAAPFTEAPTATPTAAPFKEITIAWGAGVNAQCGHQCKIHAERCTHYEFDSTTRECKLYEARTPTEAPAASCASNVLYISMDGHDGNSGCPENDALQSLAACIDRTEEGGVCYIMPGRYHFEPVHVKGKKGLTIAAAPGSKPGSVIIDGTVPIEGGWEFVNGQYISKRSQHVWQLFADGRPLTSARWPNVPVWTSDAWNQDISWAVPSGEHDGNALGTFCGHTVDTGTATHPKQKLADTRVSFDGCNLIMNNEHWETRRYKVKNHAAGSDSFDYDVPQVVRLRGSCDKYADDGKAKYFIDGCLAALDTPGEWAYNADARLVVFPYPMSEELNVRGKDQTYVLFFDGCDKVKISGLTFFATTLAAWSSKNMDISNNQFLYQSASRRSMGADVDEFDLGAHFGVHEVTSKTFKQRHKLHVPTLAIIGRRGQLDDHSSTATVFHDNVIHRSEGSGVYCRYCKDDIFENNFLGEVGYPFGRGYEFPNAFTSKGNVTVTRNTFDTDGAGAIHLALGPGVVASLNHVTNSGLLIIDNQAIWGGKNSRHDVIKYNWVHHSKGLGIRFDAGDDGVFPFKNGVMFNVVWKDLQGGIAQKSTQAINYRNTAIENQGGEDIEALGAFRPAPDMKICACYPHDCKGKDRFGQDVPAYTNTDSTTRGNIGQMDSSTKGREKTDLPGTCDHNLNLLSNPVPLDVLFRDYKNWDFRPRTGSPLIDAGSTVNDPSVHGESIIGLKPDIGAYEAGDSNYWIPGAFQSKASTPIPPSGAIDVKPDADLMWLQAKDATKYVMYLAAAKGGACDYADLPSEGVSHSTSSNIFKPGALLVPSTVYCWSVDVVTTSGANIKGDVWQFTVGCADLLCNACGTSPTVGSCASCAAPFQVIQDSGLCAPAGGCLGGRWTVVATSNKAWGGVHNVSVVGEATDVFEVREESSATCLKWNIPTTLVLYQISYSGIQTKIRFLGCSNKKFALHHTFFCTAGCYAYAGFVADSTAVSGCRLDSEEATTSTQTGRHQETMGVNLIAVRPAKVRRHAFLSMMQISRTMGRGQKDTTAEQNTDRCEA
jgi:hypothetical protein